MAFSKAIKVNQLSNFLLKAGAAQINFLPQASHTAARQTFPFPFQNAKKKKKSILFFLFSGARWAAFHAICTLHNVFTDICGRVSDFNGKQVQLSDTWPAFN